METKRSVRWPKSIRVGLDILLVLVAVLGLCYGTGWFNKPKIGVSCGAIDLGVPAKQMIEITMIRFSLSTEDAQKKWRADLPKCLRDYGMSEDKIALILKDVEKGEAKSTLKLTPTEEKIVRAAFGKASVHLMESMGKEFVIPNAVLFFEIDNTGRAAASKPHIVIRVNGSIYNHTVDSDNKILDKEQTGNELTFDLQSIAPGSKTKGIVWLCASDEKGSPQKNEVTVSHDSGTVRQDFHVDDFYLKRN